MINDFPHMLEGVIEAVDLEDAVCRDAYCCVLSHAIRRVWNAVFAGETASISIWPEPTAILKAHVRMDIKNAYPLVFQMNIAANTIAMDFDICSMYIGERRLQEMSALIGRPWAIIRLLDHAEATS